MNRTQKVIFRIMVPLLLVITGFYIYHLFTATEATSVSNFLNGLMIGLFLYWLIIIKNGVGVPKLELDDTTIKAHQPKDYGYKKENFEIAIGQIEKVNYKINVIELLTKSGETHTVHLGRFGYDDIQKLKEYLAAKCE